MASELFTSTQMFASIQQVSNDLAAAAVLAPALANAALLVAAPTLGCLRTYNSVLTDLYQANGLPMPDLAPVFDKVNFQFYKEFYTTTSVPSPFVSNCLGTEPSNMSSADVIDFVSNPDYIIGSELSNDTPEDQAISEEVSPSVNDSSVCNSSVCDSPSVDVDSFLLRAFTPFRQTTDLAETIMRLPYPSEEDKSSPTIAVDISLLQANTPVSKIGLSDTPLRVSSQIKSHERQRSCRKMVTPTNTSILSDTPLRVSSQIKSIGQGRRRLSRRIVTPDDRDLPLSSTLMVTPEPITGLPETLVRVSCHTKSPAQDLPLSSTLMITPSKPLATTSGLPATPVMVSSLTKSIDQNQPPSPMMMVTPANTSDVSEPPVTKSTDQYLPSSSTSVLTQTPVKVSSESKSPDQYRRKSSRRVVMSASTYGLSDTPVKVSSENKSPEQDIPRSHKRIVVTSIRNKTKPGLKRNRSPTKTLNIHQNPAHNSFTCPGCNNTFRKDHGLQKHLGVNPICKAIHNSLHTSSQTGQ